MGKQLSDRPIPKTSLEPRRMVADEESKEPIKRGPKGGRKHTPGRGHAHKSVKRKKKNIRKRAQKKRQAKEQVARQAWEVWDSLSAEQQKLRYDLKPDMPRPDDARESSSDKA
jgi:hypothetical protein